MSEANRKAKQPEGGFTLIELSIVLVIIGLIVGGVLVGQQMIHAAEIRASVSQIEKFESAVNTFRNKYNGMPGDLSTATTFFAGAANGDGNLILTDTNGTVTNDEDDFSDLTGELRNFWSELSVANVVDGTYVNTVSGTHTLGTGFNFPVSKLGRNGIAAYARAGTNVFHLGVADWNPTSTVFVFSNSTLSPNEAYQIDLKMDDGAPNTGTITARTGATSALVFAAPADNAVTACLTSASVFNVAVSNAKQDAPLCQLDIRMN